ncbi:MAG: methylmalonyl Co-A mutase-associated GTPase MeaB [Clostridia bacterium]|nr:methylmalonyl Co-A mutase-associated GTPase MeaB [Clostridia bacterium]
MADNRTPPQRDGDNSTYKPEWAPADADEKFASRVMYGVAENEREPHSINPETVKAARPPELTAADYIEGVLRHDRMILARAITIIESNAAKHFDLGQEIVQGLLPHAGKAVRVGITGVPGAGKSTFIEALGMRLVGSGHRVAVLAVDPSSTLSRGSILGDKTRMEQLSKESTAFIRPSPSGGTLGGVTRKSRETLLLCEAAGYDVILVETVGVGQSETTVRSMVDFFLALVITGAGDDLQGIKKGILELAEAIVVNKADGANKQKALVTRADYNQVLHYLRQATEGWQTQAYACSSLTGDGIGDIWQVVCDFMEQMRQSGQLELRRQRQNLAWVQDMTSQYVQKLIDGNAAIAGPRQAIEQAVVAGSLSPTAALRQIIAAIEKGLGNMPKNG